MNDLDDFDTSMDDPDDFDLPLWPIAVGVILLGMICLFGWVIAVSC